MTVKELKAMLDKVDTDYQGDVEVSIYVDGDFYYPKPGSWHWDVGAHEYWFTAEPLELSGSYITKPDGTLQKIKHNKKSCGCYPIGTFVKED